MTPASRPVKIGDKTANRRVNASHPPVDWSRARRSKYAVWAKPVVDNLGPVNPALEASFVKAYAASVAPE